MATTIMHQPTKNPKKFTSFKYLILITTTYIALNHHLINATWRWDDTAILSHALNSEIWDNFSDPEVWRRLSPYNLTPWLVLSFSFDYFLFGFNPLGFYIHHILSLVIFTFLLTYLARQLIDNRIIIIVLLGFLMSGAPIYIITEQLMTRHYIEGMIFCLLAIIFCLKYCDSKRVEFYIISLIFYLLSLTCKEVYVPLLGALLLVYYYKGALNKKLIYCHVIIGVAYIGWRFYMLDSTFGGYTSDLTSVNSMGFLKHLNGYVAIPKLMFGNTWPVPTAAIFALAVIYLRKKPTHTFFILSSLVFIMLPLAPLISHPGINYPDRYIFAAWVFLSLFVAISINELLILRKKLCHQIIFVLFLSITLPSAAYQAFNHRGYASKMGAEFDKHANFIINNKDIINLHPSPLVLDSGWFITALLDLKKRLPKQEGEITIITDKIFILSVKDNYWSYDHDCRCIANKTSDLESIKLSLSKLIESDKPLHIQMEYHRKPDRVEWKLGPYTTGIYELLSPDNYSVIKIKPVGSYNIHLDPTKDVRIYFKYTDPTGWSTYSPTLEFGSVTPVLHWKR